MCKLCKCDTVKQSTTTHVINYKNNIIVIKNVPCEECEPAIGRLLTDAICIKPLLGSHSFRSWHALRDDVFPALFADFACTFIHSF